MFTQPKTVMTRILGMLAVYAAMSTGASAQVVVVAHEGSGNTKHGIPVGTQGEGVRPPPEPAG